MSVMFAMWCVASGVYTGFLCVRKGLEVIRRVTNKIYTLTEKAKVIEVAEVKKDVQ